MIRAALRVKGDSLSLARVLRVPSTTLFAGLAGEKPGPEPIFERALRIVLDSLEPASKVPALPRPSGTAAAR